MMTTKFKLTINLLLVFLVLLDVILSTLCLFFFRKPGFGSFTTPPTLTRRACCGEPALSGRPLRCFN